ncbi:MAG TPA: PD-(D/E)XK nuclease family protein [Bacteroidales bacterium]|nr:PD-(D/E)XK nuclease family protein [Bacteroidales bacterium]
MEYFLQKAASYIISNYKDNIKNLKIIVPNKRSSLYLKKYISQKITEPIYCPEIMAIEDFIMKLSKLEIIDNTYLLLEFYKTYCDIETEDSKKNFQEVLRWAGQVLNDFNEIDLYLIDDNIFEAINEVAAIKTWNLGAPLTYYQKKYLTFYHSLKKYYNAFKNQLLKKGYSYQGLAFRMATEKLNTIKNDEKFVFLGFNALTPAEEKIIFTLQKNKLAEILWDVDNYYYSNTEHEAGQFLRRYLSKNKNFNWLEYNIEKEEKEITITGVHGKVLQAKYAGRLIEEQLNQTNNVDKTAIILVDDKLLFPILNSIPKELNNFNITMGLPLRQLTISEIYQNLFDIHLNKKIIKNEEVFLSENIINFLKHPYIIRLLDNNYENIFTKNNHNSSIYISLKDFINNFYNNVNLNNLKLLLSSWEDNSITALNNMQSITNLLINSFTTSTEKEYLSYFNNIFNKLSETIINLNLNIDIKSLYALFNNVLKYIKIPFYGEPLQDLQIMGLLETRTLDFEKIIILSANENILPTNSLTPTFIPADIRRAYGLPFSKGKDAIYAYHFYRLIQRSKKIHIIYNTKENDFNSGEKSRFIEQIETELPLVNPKIKIIKNILSFKEIQINSIKPISIIKDDLIINNIKEKAKKGFTPTDLNNFIACPLKFYFNQIAKIKDVDDDPYTINSYKFGSIIHEVLKRLYSKCLNSKISSEILTKMQSDVAQTIKGVIDQDFSNIDISTGQNFLAVVSIKKIIENYFSIEKECLANHPDDNFIVSMSEEELQFSTNININNEIIPITLKGKVDRVDTNNDIAFIIDYKTGKTDEKELVIYDFEDLTNDSKFAKSLQLLVYTFLFSKNKKCNANFFEAGIIQLRKSQNNIIKVRLNNSEKFEHGDLKKVEEKILSIIYNIFNKDIPFYQTDNVKEICVFCPYITICGRD